MRTMSAKKLNSNCILNLKLVLILFILSLLHSFSCVDEGDIDVKFANFSLIAFEGTPIDVAASNVTGNIYVAVRQNDSENANIFVYNQENDTFERLEGVDEVKCLAYDYSNGEVVIGTTKGLIIYSEEERNITRRLVDNNDFRQISIDRKTNEIFYTDNENIYFVDEMRRKTSVYSEGRYTGVASVVSDGKGNLFFVDNQGRPKAQLERYSKPFTYEGLVDPRIVLKYTTGEVYAYRGGYLFQLGVDNILPKLVTKFDFDITALDFDNDDLIVGRKGEMLRYFNVNSILRTLPHHVINSLL